MVAKVELGQSITKLLKNETEFHYSPVIGGKTFSAKTVFTTLKNGRISFTHYVLGEKYQKEIFEAMEKTLEEGMHTVYIGLHRLFHKYIKSVTEVVGGYEVKSYCGKFLVGLARGESGKVEAILKSKPTTADAESIKMIPILVKMLFAYKHR